MPPPPGALPEGFAYEDELPEGFAYEVEPEPAAAPSPGRLPDGSKDPAHVALRMSTLGTRVAPDRRSTVDRARAYLSGRDPNALSGTGSINEVVRGEIGGREIPTPASVGRAIQSVHRGSSPVDALGVAMPAAPADIRTDPRLRGMRGGEGMSRAERIRGSLEGRDMRAAAPLLGFSQTAMANLGDEAIGAIAGDDARDVMRTVEDVTHEQAPGSYAVGQAGAVLPLALAPPVGAGMAGATGVATRIGSQAGLGAALEGAAGAGASEADSIGGRLSEAGPRALTGGAVGAAGAGLGELAGPLARWASRERLAASGLNPSAARGTRQGQAIARLGGPDEVARMLDQERIGGRFFPTPGGVPDSIAELRASAGPQLEGVLQRMDEAASVAPAGSTRGRVPTLPYAQGLQAGAQRIAEVPTGRSQAAAELMHSQYVAPLLDETGNLRTEALPWRLAQRLRTQLGNEANAWSRSSNPAETSAAGLADEARFQLSDLMGEAAEGVEPGLRDAWRSANRRWALSEMLERDARVGGSNFEDALSSGFGMAEGGPVNAMAARAAQSVWSRARPAVFARSLQGLSAMLRRNPDPRAQGWSRVLDQARARGPTALAAAHFALSRRNPEYRAAVERMQEEEAPIEGEEQE